MQCPHLGHENFCKVRGRRMLRRGTSSYLTVACDLCNHSACGEEAHQSYHEADDEDDEKSGCGRLNRVVGDVVSGNDALAKASGNTCT